jgi:hypothetical protein
MSTGLHTLAYGQAAAILIWRLENGPPLSDDEVDSDPEAWRVWVRVEAWDETAPDLRAVRELDGAERLEGLQTCSPSRAAELLPKLRRVFVRFPGPASEAKKLTKEERATAKMLKDRSDELEQKHGKRPSYMKLRSELLLHNANAIAGKIDPATGKKFRRLTVPWEAKTKDAKEQAQAVSRLLKRFNVEELVKHDEATK